MPGEIAPPADDRLLTEVVGIGLLTKVFHRDLVDTIINETGRAERRKRLLPARVVLYFVLALTLYADQAYEEVMRRLVRGLSGLKAWRGEWTIPSDSAISQARTRLGFEPFEALFNRAAVPVARPGAISAFFAGKRVVAIDGVVLTVPDSPANAAEFGYSGKENINQSAFPQVRMVTLTEVGTHATIGAALGGIRTGERALASEVIETYLRDDMLLVADRGFYSYAMWRSTAATGADLLWRISDTLEVPVIEYLPDDSYLGDLVPPPKVKADLIKSGLVEPGEDLRIRVRVIEYIVEGRGETQTIRLLTSILDPDRAPGRALAAVYDERWEHELVFDEIKTHQMSPAKILRSKTPDLVKQEIWAHLLTHYAIRAFIADAAEDIGDDPDRYSYIRAIRLVRRSVDDQAGFSPPQHSPRQQPRDTMKSENASCATAANGPARG